MFLFHGVFEFLLGVLLKIQSGCNMNLDNIGYSVFNSVRRSVYETVRDSARLSIWDYTGDSVARSVRDFVRDSVWNSARFSAWVSAQNFTKEKYESN